MTYEVIQGLALPFIGTMLGSACVFFMRKGMHPTLRRALTGFAAGVMVAASIWSLLIPAMNQAEHMGKWAFVPAAVGFLLGIVFLLFRIFQISGGSRCKPLRHRVDPTSGWHQTPVTKDWQQRLSDLAGGSW